MERTGFLHEMLRSRKAMFGAIVVLLIVLSAVLSPWLAPYDPNLQNLIGRLAKPLTSTADGHFHLLGTDQLGRDIVSRLIYGARVSLLVGAFASLIAGTIGVTLGLIAGYNGGRTDAAIMRLCDVQLALPYILIAISVLAVLGAGLINIIIVLSLTQWVTYARVVRSGALSVKEKEFVLAARALGFRAPKIMLRYVLPNVFAPVIVIATFSVAQTIVAESALSFLGLSVPPSIPSWGGMLADGRTYLVVAWWLATLPGLAITLTVIGVNLFGDWLRDYLDPKLQL
jgi:peptide/nickel transport system permease protein